MSTAIVLETDRLRLRQWDKHYGELLKEHCNTPTVLQHLEGRSLSSAEHDALIDWLISQQEDYGISFWVLEARTNDEFLGFCGLVKVDEMDSTVLGATEIGWRLRADRHGGHFASEAAKACMHLAFDQNGDDDGYWNVCDGLRVVSRTSPDNEPSWRLMQRLGMKYDPRLDYMSHGKRQIVHVMTYDDWQTQKNIVSDTRLPAWRSRPPSWWKS